MKLIGGLSLLALAVTLTWTLAKHDDPSAATTHSTTSTGAAEAELPQVQLARGPGRTHPRAGIQLWLSPSTLQIRGRDGQPDEVLLELVDGRPQANPSHQIEPLYQALGGEEIEDTLAHETITLFVDQRIPWSTIVDVLYTAGRVGYHEWEFALTTEHGVRVLSVSPPKYAELDHELRPVASLQLWIDPDTIQVSANIGRPMEQGIVRALDVGNGTCALPLRERAAASEALRRLATSLCELGGVKVSAWVAASNELRWGEVAAVLADISTGDICDGGITFAMLAPPEDCELPASPLELAGYFDSQPTPPNR